MIKKTFTNPRGLSALLLLAAMLIHPAAACAQYHPEAGASLAHTFSIVARDSITGEMAVGVQSHWFSVGTLVSWGKSGAGVVATQSFVNPSYGPLGLERMASGEGADRALEALVRADEGRDYRQVAFLDAQGGVASYTGSKCVAVASFETGANYAIQANMMLNDRVVPAMAEAFRTHAGLPLAERVVEAMEAGQEAGGDIRGRQSAVLLVVGPDPVNEPWLDKRIDLRVDDDRDPVQELGRLLRLHRAYEQMNAGDLAVERGDMKAAMDAYTEAGRMFPANLEMKYWRAVAMANNGQFMLSLPLFKQVFYRDENWRELTRRLPASGLLQVSPEELSQILGL
ncbi:MAG: DUF1028 domain-containing protein [Bacteroidales bacterium]